MAKYMKKGKRAGKKGGKRGMKGKKQFRSKRSLTGGSDFARVKVTLPQELQVSTGSTYGLYNFSLSNSTRAIAVAAGFEQYRITRVRMFVKPNADTFPSSDVAILPNPPGAYGIPYMYYRIDKTGTFDNVNTNLQALRIAGCKPIRVDDKTITISWKPSVPQGTNDAGAPPAAPVLTLAGNYKLSPWLPTNANAANPAAAWAANSVDHYGISMCFDSPRQTQSWPCANVTFEITYEFRKPLWQYIPPPGMEQPRIKPDLDVLGQ